MFLLTERSDKWIICLVSKSLNKQVNTDGHINADFLIYCCVNMSFNFFGEFLNISLKSALIIATKVI